MLIKFDSKKYDKLIKYRYLSEILPRQMNESQARVNQGQETESNLQRQQVRDWVDEQIQQYPNL